MYAMVIPARKSAPESPKNKNSIIYAIKSDKIKI